MAKSDFLPRRDSDLDSFEVNFIEKLAVHSAELGLEPAVVSDITRKINDHRVTYSAMVSKKSDVKFSKTDQSRAETKHGQRVKTSSSDGKIACELHCSNR